MKTFQFNKLVRDKIPAKVQKDNIGNFQVSVLATIINAQNLPHAAVNLTQTPGLKKELRYFKKKYLLVSAKSPAL